MGEEFISHGITRTEIEATGRVFGRKGEITEIVPIITGHINETFKVVYRNGDAVEKYTFQAINTNVFKKPDEVMSNISAVTEYIRNKYVSMGESYDRRVLEFQKAEETGLYYYIDEENHFWRVYKYVDNASTYNEAPNTDSLYNAGRSFGKFQMLLSDFPMDTLFETIPDFHNTAARYDQLDQAIAADQAGRVSEVQEEIAFFEERRKIASRFNDLQKEGKLPLRVTHNDTKCNNVLIDDQTGEGVCIIDLDTVMPGLSVNDFGDAIRSCSNSAAEDEKDLSKVYFKRENFDAFARGFLEASSQALTPCEIDNMVWGAIMMTLECGSRFLADYLNGDTYFRTTRPGQNLDRCRTQMKLVSEMEKMFDSLNETVHTEAAKHIGK